MDSKQIHLRFKSINIKQTFNKYLSQKYSFHLNRNSSEYIRNINNEVDTLSGTINFY